MRVRSIDLIRGICILFMLVTHAFSFWLAPSSMWLFTLEGITAGSICASGFVFVSGTSFGFSWAKDDRSGVPQNVQFLKGLASSIALLLLALFNNMLSTISNGEGFPSLFYWHLFQCLAFSRLLGLLFVKVDKLRGILLVVALIAFGAIFMNAIDYGATSEPFKFFLYTIFFRRLEDYPLFIYFPFYLMGIVVGKQIQEVTETSDLNSRMIKNWVQIGILFMITGLILGLHSSSQVLGWPLLEWLSTYPFSSLTTLPFFTILDSYAWCLFFTGFQICLQMILFFYWDSRPRKSLKEISKKGMLDLFGKYSLTIYIGHMVIYIFPLPLDSFTIWMPTVVFALLIWLWFYYMDKLGKGKISLEHVMGLLTAWLFRKFTEKSGTKIRPNQALSIITRRKRDSPQGA